MSTTNNLVFKGLHIVAWIIFVGLCIEAGALIVNFFFSMYNPAFVRNLYQKLDLSTLYSQSHTAFYYAYSLIIFIAIMKAALFYIVIKLMHKMDLTNPFNSFVEKHISLISNYTILIGIVAIIARHTLKNLSHRGLEVKDVYTFLSDGQAFILLGAVIYIIAVIFKRGIELQKENDLTI